MPPHALRRVICNDDDCPWVLCQQLRHHRVHVDVELHQRLADDVHVGVGEEAKRLTPGLLGIGWSGGKRGPLEEGADTIQ